MANIKSQKKRIRQDAKRNLRNKSIKTELKSSYNENGELIPENKIAVLKELDKAHTDGIISKNYRDRNKSRISKL